MAGWLPNTVHLEIILITRKFLSTPRPFLVPTKTNFGFLDLTSKLILMAKKTWIFMLRYQQETHRPKKQTFLSFCVNTIGHHVVWSLDISPLCLPSWESNGRHSQSAIWTFDNYGRNMNIILRSTPSRFMWDRLFTNH